MGPTIKGITAIILLFTLTSLEQKKGSEIIVFYKEPSCHGCHIAIGNYLLENNKSVKSIKVIITDSVISYIDRKRELIQAKSYYKKRGLNVKFSFMYSGNNRRKQKLKSFQTKIYKSSKPSPSIILTNNQNTSILPYNLLFNESGAFFGRDSLDRLLVKN